MGTTSEKSVILILIPHYLPGHKAGGPIRSVANLIQALGDEFAFKVVTSDRDLGSNVPYSDIITDTWIPVGKAQVMYLSGNVKSLISMLHLLRSLDYEVLYLSSFFAQRFSMFPVVLRKLHLGPRRPTLLAPRGEFAPGALALKSRRKAWYLKVSTTLRFYRDIVWHASSQFEAQDIRRALPRPGQRTLIVANPLPIDANAHMPRGYPEILVASDTLATAQSSPNNGEFRSKSSGQLDVVFLSRIARMKNLHTALSHLHGLRGQVRFDIYGPIEDAAYWDQCQRIIGQLPANVHVTYRGEVPHDAVLSTLSGYDLFLLPTHGENFGHVIHEALSAGCPVLISNRTPWRDLEALGVGWDLPLEEPERFHTVLQQCLDMDADMHRALSLRARLYGIRCSSDPATVEQNRSMLNYMLSLARVETQQGA